MFLSFIFYQIENFLIRIPRSRFTYGMSISKSKSNSNFIFIVMFMFRYMLSSYFFS